MVSANEAGFNLRGTMPLAHFAEWASKWGQTECGLTHRDSLSRFGCPKDDTDEPELPRVHLGAAISGTGCSANRHLRDLVESINGNLGDLSGDVKESGSRGLETTPENLRCV
jgi:hypothetical protein